jgi:hypothetical protein
MRYSAYFELKSNLLFHQQHNTTQRQALSRFINKMPKAQKITSNSVSREWISYLAGGFFIGMSIWAIFEMRLSKASTSLDLPMKMTTNTLQFSYRQQRLRNVYTGFGPLDYGLSFLVTAFLPAVAGWDKGLQIQQIYFLFSVFPLISNFSVDSVRQSNIGSIVSLYVLD